LIDDKLPQGPEECTCLALRQAARHVTQFYDQHLASAGLRTTQFSILAKLARSGSMTINDLAAQLVMDRTTLGRNVLPLQRDGLIDVAPGQKDRRSKALRLTPDGRKRLLGARDSWSRAQACFAEIFGPERTAGLRASLHAVAATALPAYPPATPGRPV
jgi:DNA-binding MarR family transcriptional regulator